MSASRSSDRSLPARRTFLAAAGAAPFLLAGAAPAVAKGTFPEPGRHTPVAAIRSYADMVAALRRLQDTARYPVTVSTLRELGITPGTSEAGRDLYVATVGTGPQPIWLQGRIHGDEPYGTDALVAILKELGTSGAAEWGAIRDAFTVHVIPMYNPDGSELNIRQTVLEDGTRLDLNRDWAAFRADESQSFYRYWTEVKPSYALDIHHQGLKTTPDGTDEITMSLGISLAPGGPTLPTLHGGAYDVMTRKMQGHVYESLLRYGSISMDRYSVGTLEIDIKGGATSAMMLGLDWNGLNPTGHSCPAIFFETSGNTRDGSIGQKARGHLVRQNILGTGELLLGLADGSVAATSPNVWNSIPHVDFTGYQTDAGVVPGWPAA